MPETGQRSSDSRQEQTPLALLHSIVRAPESLEGGLRFLAMHPVRHGQAYLAWGFDSTDRPIMLYVSADVVRMGDLHAEVVPLTRRLAQLPSRGNRGSGRVLTLAARFAGDLLHGPAVLPGGWEVELLLWHGVTAAPLVESAAGSSPGGEAALDPPSTEREEPPFHTEPSASTRLSAEEIESLVGSWPTGSRA